ncbi:hypothetical protein QBC44DRAFT_49185 [Cladorrhinum sp. PSN332]|nr:hypothetical protein QBC44DRAFT_49185 [Cladorrhinum sp. PSN332]
MEPISALSIAAASFQFVEAVIHGIRLLRKLKDGAPTKFSELLDDTEKSLARIIQIQRSLNDGASTFSKSLSSSQITALQRATQDVCHATEDLQRALKPVFGSSGTKKFWKYVVSVKMEPGIETMLNRIRRSGDQLMRELQLAGLEVETLLVEKIDSVTARLEELLFNIKDINRKIDEQKPTALDLPTRSQQGIATVKEIDKTAFTHEPSRELNYHPETCDCRFIQKLKRMGGPRTLVSCETRQHHESTCLYGVAGAYCYRMSFQLPPIFNKKLEFGVGATIQRGGLRLDMPFRLFSTVKRSGSPIFQLFDNFAESCGARKLELEANRMYRCLSQAGDPFGGFEWDVEAVQKQLVHIRNFLRHAQAKGLGSVTDKDEHGYTILHTIVSLVILLVPVYQHVAEEIGALLEFVERSGVDRDAFPWTNDSPNSGRYTFHFYHWRRPGSFRLRSRATAADKARDIFALFMPELSQTRAPFSNYLSKMSSGEFDEQETQLHEPAYSMELGTRAKRSIRDELIRRPFVSRCLSFRGSLAQIVVTRDLRRLEQALANSSWESQAFGHRGLSVVDLAVGWPEGLRAFSDVWKKDVIAAICLAVMESDQASLECLCNLFPNPIAAPDSSTKTEIPKFIKLFLVNADTRDFLVGFLKQQRLDLAKLARKYLSTNDLTQLGFSLPGLLDTKALQTYDLLMERSIAPDTNLHPGFGSSVYHTIASTGFTLADLNGNDSLVLTEGLQALFTEGFWEIDARDSDGRTPLENLLIQSKRLNTMLVAPCVWFLKTGASPVFENERAPKNLLFGLASAISATEWDSEWSRQALKLAEYAAGVCRPSETDMCVCHCSEDGCLPLHYIPCHGRLRLPCYECSTAELFTWLELSGLDEDDEKYCLEQAARAEVFRRLGMVHTCCRGALGPSSSNVTDKDERVRVRDDDEELASQLELLLDAYRGSLSIWLDATDDEMDDSAVFSCTKSYKGCHTGNSRLVWNGLAAHWKEWWYKAGQILPEPAQFLGEAWGSREEHDAMVVDAQALTLKQYGYDPELEFVQVIRRHFSEELEAVAQYSVSGPEGEQEQRRMRRAERVFVPAERTEVLDEIIEGWKQDTRPRRWTL